MRSLLPLALASAALLLSACGGRGVQTPASYPLSGTIGGDWGSSPNLRLQLVGTGLPTGIKFTSNIGQNVVPNVGGAGWTYGFDLPRIPDALGIYQVYAYNDVNNDARLNLGETFARNRQYLIYSPVNTTVGPIDLTVFNLVDFSIPQMNVTAGWNVYDKDQGLSSSNPRPFAALTGYDLSR